MEHTKISTDIEQNIKQFQQLFADSADIKMKEMRLGKGKRRRCFLAYIEVAVSNMLLETTALGRLLAALSELPDRDLNQVLNENAMGISDVTPYDTIEDAAQGMLTGDAILFVDGYGHALKIADKGYPGMGVQEPDSEKVIRGSKEGFTDSIKTNTALIRKRVRSTRVKVEEVQEGVRSHTAIDLVYMADLKYESVLRQIREKITEYEIDGVMDSGILEQLAEKKWYSPFPQFQTTQRPDRAALAVLEGRIVLLCDNSPVALILPTDLNSFLKTSDDYYNRFGVATFARILRYMAAFFAMTLPGLYLAVTNFHTQILPTPLLLSFSKLAAQNVLCYVLLRVLELLHPFMPFITEEIWQALPHEGDFLIRAQWPEYQERFAFTQEENAMEAVKDAISAVRARRSEMNVPPSRKAKILIVTQTPDIYAGGRDFIMRLAYASEVEVQAQSPEDLKGMVTVATHNATLYLPLAELVDIRQELERIAKEKTKAEENLARIEKKLQNESFVSKAPEAVVNAEREKADKARALIAKLEESAAAMRG